MTSQFEMKYLAPGIVVFSQAFLTLFIGLLISLDKSSIICLYFNCREVGNFIANVIES